MGKRITRQTEKAAAATTTPRQDRSLRCVACKVIAILRRSVGSSVSVKELASVTCVRRCYDVILVLEAAGLVQRIGKQQVRWLQQPDEGDNGDGDGGDGGVFRCTSTATSDTMFDEGLIGQLLMEGSVSL